MILNGKFDVESLNFAKNVKKGEEKYSPAVNRKKQDKIERGRTVRLMYDSDEDGDEDKEKDKNKKTLTCGDFFGEVSIIYNCKRTSSVVGNTYGTYGKLQEETVLELFT